MTAGLVHHGYSIADACAAACRANRMAGLFARPTPATQIYEIIARIPEALSRVLPGFEGAGAYQQEFLFEGVQQ
jgi:NAD(P)H-hydrate repair Nnr-like enzyme with NAD(P)H-hydrate dehydratase domain